MTAKYGSQQNPSNPAPGGGVHHQDQPIGGALGGAMKEKYGGQGHHELGAGGVNHQDKPIGGALGDAMKDKYGGQHHELGAGGVNHQDQPIGGGLGDAM